MYQRRLTVVGSFLLAVALFVWPIASSGQTSAVKNVSTAFNSYYVQPTTIGWEFSLSKQVQVTHLGFWDNGFLADHRVGIWDADKVLLADATVKPGDTSTDGYKFTAIVPVTLAPGTYRIGALLTGGVDPDGFAVEGASGTFDPSITWIRNQRGFVNQGFQYPLLTVDTAASFAYLNANFRFQDPTPVPEPALLQLPFLVGLGGLVYVWRRSSH